MTPQDDVPMLEEEEEEEEYDTVRAERRANDKSANRLRGKTAIAFLFIGALVFIVAGASEIVLAEKERKDGWVHTTCHISHDFSYNDSACIYFGVTTGISGNNTLCAVPATIASKASFLDPPACNSPATEDVVYWRSLRAGANVECFVPKDVYYAVTARTCISTTTSGHGLAAIVWRTWIERLVYIMRTSSEGAVAIEAVLSIRKRTGEIVMAVGIVIMLIVGIIVRQFCCMEQRMASDKVY